MHIITGMLISFLMSKNKGVTKPPLLQVRWPIQTSHLLPGRVRFHIPLYKGNQKGLDSAIVQIRKIEGVSNAHANSISGSVLIQFDESKLQADLLFAALIRLLGLEKEIERTPVPKLNKEISEIYKSINQAVYAKTNGILDVKTAVALIIAATGVYRIFAERSISMPATLTMIWWAYNSFTSNTETGNDG
jgi:hypothetical protein